MRAFNNIDRFRPGTNLKAWLFTIVRNEHYSQLRRRKFEAHGVDTDLLPEPSVPPDHDGKLELRDLNQALSSLSPGQRTALILVSVSGFSYEEAATICDCAVGTIKSRVARARETLLEMLKGRQPLPDRSDGNISRTTTTIRRSLAYRASTAHLPRAGRLPASMGAIAGWLRGGDGRAKRCYRPKVPARRKPERCARSPRQFITRDVIVRCVCGVDAALIAPLTQVLIVLATSVPPGDVRTACRPSTRLSPTWSSGRNPRLHTR